MTRINKFISICGITSRRGADALIKKRRVSVNGKIIDSPGVIVDEENDVVKVDGAEISPVTRKIYVVLNKPANVMTTAFDPFRRRTVMYYLKKLSHRVYPVGRLDYDTEGLLLLTNDGDLAYRLAHPRYEVPKVYEVKVVGHFKPEDASHLLKGVKLNDGATGRATNVAILGFQRNLTRVRITLTEGRKREIKQLCKAVGHPVEHLERVEYAGLSARELRRGRWRYLNDREVLRLKHLVGL